MTVIFNEIYFRFLVHFTPKLILTHFVPLGTLESLLEFKIKIFEHVLLTCSVRLKMEPILVSYCLCYFLVTFGH